MSNKKGTVIFGDNFYGFPEDGKMKVEGRFIPVWNRKYKRPGRIKRHNATCPECGEKKKNINFHYRKYHFEWYKKMFIDPLEKGEIGKIEGIRFIETKSE